MSDVSSGMPARLVLDWRRGSIGPLAALRAVRQPALNRSPVTGRALSQGLRRDLDRPITPVNASELARLIRAYTPRGGEPR